jgi:hypothetical protein
MPSSRGTLTLAGPLPTIRVTADFSSTSVPAGGLVSMTLSFWSTGDSRGWVSAHLRPAAMIWLRASVSVSPVSAGIATVCGAGGPLSTWKAKKPTAPSASTTARTIPTTLPVLRRGGSS